MKIMRFVGGKRLSKENKLTMTDFVINDQFELNNYISYLFYQSPNNDYSEREPA
jgi:hypothetical protein